MPEDVGITELRRRMRAALTAAMKARDAEATKALRTALGAIDNAGAIAVDAVDAVDARTSRGPIAGAALGLGAGEAGRRELTLADVASILQAEIAEHLASAAEYEAIGKADGAAALRRQADVLATFLPRA